MDSGLFDEIYLNFLPVGHTHCDADQIYSRYSLYFSGMSYFVTYRSFQLPGESAHVAMCIYFATFKFNLDSCCFPAAHSAFDFEEFAACLKKAYADCKVVEKLEKFTNFTDTVKNLLNNASTTPGADNFSEFRYSGCQFLYFYLQPIPN